MSAMRYPGKLLGLRARQVFLALLRSEDVWLGAGVLAIGLVYVFPFILGPAAGGVSGDVFAWSHEKTSYPFRVMGLSQAIREYGVAGRMP